MIEKIIEYVTHNNSSDLKLYELVKVTKAKSVNPHIIEGLNSIETSIAISIKRNKALLEILKDGLGDYAQQFSNEFNLLYEVIDDKFLVLNKIKGGYQVLFTAKSGGIIASKTYVEQVEAMKYFIELYKSE